MSHALGQPVPLRAQVYDDAGTADDATSATLTITLPDGTTATPTVTHPSTGVYHVDYLPAMEGLYATRWVFSGSNASAPLLDSFYVEASSAVPLVSLAEVREQCRATSGTDDDRLQWYALVASQMAEDHTQIWRRTTVTSTKDGGGRLVRLSAPVLSVTTVTEDGIAVASTGYTLDGAHGWLYRGDQNSLERWSPGVQNIAVTYVAGPAGGVIPAGIRQGVLLQTQHMWDSQRGGSGVPRQSGADFTVDVRTGFSIPNRVLELWRSQMPVLVA